MDQTESPDTYVCSFIFTLSPVIRKVTSPIVCIPGSVICIPAMSIPPAQIMISGFNKNVDLDKQNEQQNVVEHSPLQMSSIVNLSNSDNTLHNISKEEVRQFPYLIIVLINNSCLI